MMVAGEDTPESYLKEGVDWILKNLLLAIELLITGTVFQRTVLVASERDVDSLRAGSCW